MTHFSHWVSRSSFVGLLVTVAVLTVIELLAKIGITFAPAPIYLTTVAYAAFRDVPAGWISTVLVVLYDTYAIAARSPNSESVSRLLLALASLAIVGIVHRSKQSQHGASVSTRQAATSFNHQDHSRFKRLIDSNMIGCAVWTVDGMITDANDAFLQMVGYTRDELQAGLLNWRAMTPPDQISLSEHSIAQMQKIGNSDPLEKEYIHKTGRRVPVLLGGVMFEESQTAGVSLVVDLTERKRSERALQQSEEQFRQLAENIDAIFWIMDLASGHLLYVSPVYEQVFGRSRDSLSSARGWLDAVHPDDQHRVKPLFCSNASREAFDQEYRVVRPDGSIRWVHNRGFPIHDAFGRAYRFAGVAEDITDRKWAESALEASEALYRTLSEAVPHLVWSLLPDGNIDYVNQQWQDYIGFTVKQINQNGWKLIIHPDDLSAVSQQWNHSLQTGDVIGVEARLRSADGTYRWFTNRAVPLRDTNDQIIRWIVTSTDIHDRKQFEEGLQQRTEDSQNQQRWLEDVLNLLPLPVLFIETGTARVTFANRAADELAGGEFPKDRPAEEYDAVYYCTDADGKRLLFEQMPGVRLARGERLDGMEMDWHTPAGIRSLIVFADMLPAMHGQPALGVLVFQDISERKRAELERDRLLKCEQIARAEAESANRIKDEFLAVLSHELRSPLNPILGWIKLLRTRQFDAATTSRALETIDRNAKLQAELIEDLLDVSRILQGKLVLNVAPVDLVAIVDAATETVRLSAEAKSIRLQVIICHSTLTEPDDRSETLLNQSFQTSISAIQYPNFQVMGDNNRLQQIIWNLLSNAIKFTPNNGQIDVRISQVAGGNDSSFGITPGGYAQIQVVDTGKGINPNFLPHVFDSFRQADSSTTRSFGGLGLGLAIVRHLTELHGGKVFADSAGEAQGSTFTVQLPLMPAESRIRAETDRNGLYSSLDSSVDDQFSLLPLTGVRVLIVDDEVDTRNLIEFALQQAGAQVDAAASAQQVRLLLNQSIPDILISDIGMPKEDGYRLMQWLRSQPQEQGGQLPAIALTAYAGESDRQRALNAGFQLHLTKPIEPTRLIAAVSRLAKAKASVADVG